MITFSRFGAILLFAGIVALHPAIGRIHKRFLTPTVSTLGMGAISIAVTVPLILISESVLADSLTATGFGICFYYGFTGIACAVYYRRELLKSARKLLMLGIVPLAGAAILFGVFVKAAIFYGHKANVESPPIAGITLPLWLGIGGLLLGFVLMLVSRLYFRAYFSRKTETAPPGLLEQPVEHAPAHF